MNETWYSNCLVEAIKAKFKSWSNTKIIPLYSIPSTGGWHLHVVWYDKRQGIYKHFTHKSLEGNFTSLLFRGMIETITQEKIERWAKENAPHLGKYLKSAS